VSDDMHNVFISHRHEDDARLSDLKDLVRRNGMKLRDSSITSEKPNNAKSERYIKEQILRPQIKWAGTLVTYISPDTKNHWWVDWEIEEAHRQGKRIVGVWERGARGCELPEAFKKYGDALVGWNGESIADAIAGKSDKWYQQDGSEKQYQDVERCPRC